MYYPKASSLDATITKGSQEYLLDQVREEIVEKVPSDSYWETDQLLPLKYDKSISTLTIALFPFADGSFRTNAVYVLEGLRSPTSAGTALLQGVSSKSLAKYTGLDGYRRVLYVGVTSNLIQRLDQHLNSPADDGAYFTALYPPVRILQVGWFRTYQRAERAEKITANLLRERFPNDFVAYPG